MRALRFGLAFLVCLTLSVFTQYVFARDIEYGTEDDPCVIDWVGDILDLDLLHEDAEPFKGSSTIWVKNWSNETWGDFHLKIKGFNIDNVSFDEYLEPQLWLYEGGSWQQYMGLTWNIDNTVVGAEMNLFFYGNPIENGEKAKIKVYTDNTTDRLSWFRIAAYPTPVPEPATIALLGLGSIGLLRRKRSA